MKSNSEIADELARLAQLLSAGQENPYKIRAYRRASTAIRDLSESLDELVRNNSDLTQYAGIGEGIAHAIREIVLTGASSKLEDLRSHSTSQIVDLNQFPKLDPKRALQIYKKLGIDSIEALRAKLDSGELEQVMGARMAQHVSQALNETHAVLLVRADELNAGIEEFLLGPCQAKRALATGDCRLRLELIEQLDFVVETADFAALVEKMQTFGGNTPLVRALKSSAVFTLAAGIPLRIESATKANWGGSLISTTGSAAHLRKLKSIPANREALKSPTEVAFYNKLSLSFIEPELRNGTDEIELASQNKLPSLITVESIRGDLHSHSTSSDGVHSIEQMAAAARQKGYEYLGITDHSQSLKIANGVSIEDLWKQIRYIDRLNEKNLGIRILKSSEVDILADGTLDYPDDLLKELDYTVCSIHSRFGLGEAAQTDRLLRAMDNRYFNILGHATGRRLLKRPGYEIDLSKLISHAKQNGCFFEINSNPERLDISPENARAVRDAGIKLFVNTDAHSTGELDLLTYGIDQARRAGLSKSDVMNCLPWTQLKKQLKR